MILDTDIGTDIDDTWALAMLTRCPELDLRLVLTVSGDTLYRARLAGAVLDAGSHGHVPIGVGPPTPLPGFLDPALTRPLQAGLAESYALEEHPGGVREDGVEALVDCIMGSPEPVTLIGIGPMTNVGAALALEPRIVENARLVAMLGSLRRGLLDSPDPGPEYNVAVDIPACRAALAADWEVTITPLDSCGAVVLDGERYQKLRGAGDPLLETVFDTYRDWEDRALGSGFFDRVQYSRGMSERRSTILFDTVAVYLAYSEACLKMETLPISVADDSTMHIVEGAPEVRVGVACDLPRFLDHLTDRLLPRS